MRATVRRTPPTPGLGRDEFDPGPFDPGPFDPGPFGPYRLTRRQAEIVLFVAEVIARSGRPPTYRDICDRFGFASPAAVGGHVKALAAKGAVAHPGGRSRGIVLTGLADLIGDLVRGHARVLVGLPPEGGD